MSDLSADEEELTVELMMKSRVHHIDTESAVTSDTRTSQEGLDDGRNITSLYLQRQESDLEGDKFRKYMQNKDIFRNNRKRQIFKQAEKEGVEKVDYTRYRKRLCSVGIPTTKDENICGCGRSINDMCHGSHKKEEEDRGTWDFRKHTKLSVTDAYGRISFGSERRSKYVRVEADTPVSEIFELLTQVYSLQTPGVILSVVGSLMGFTVSPKIEKIIQRGMIKAAITTNGWITTAGFNAGHVISVGDALRAHNHSVPCIGFPSWGCLPDNVQETLVVKEQSVKRGVYQCRYPKLEIEPGSSRENLNGNHSHFIISDTGAVTDWGSESFMRTQLEAYLKNVMHIPVVQVVIQGGLGVARHLHEAVKSGTTSVIVYGSGGVCDLLVDLIRHHDSLENLPDQQLHNFSRKLQNKTKMRRNSTASPEESETSCTCSARDGVSFSCPEVVGSMINAGLTKEARQNPSFKLRIKEMVTTYRDFLILFDMEDEHYDGLDTALLEALVKAQNMSDEATNAGNIQLSGVQVALGWNRPDFAEKLLNSDSATKDEKALGSILMHALAWNLYDFTELLLAHGASIPMVAANMVLLYGSTNNVDHLKRYARYHLGSSQQSEAILNDKRTVDRMIDRLSGTQYSFNSNVSNESDPYFELMVWAVLSLYPEIAELMWSNTQEPIKGALFVLMILRKLQKSKKVIITNHEKETIQFMRKRFERLAIDIMDLLHQNCDLILREKAIKSGWERLNAMTYIDMAYVCKAKDFVAHPACQELQDKRWKKGLTSEVGFFTTILVFLCPFLVMSPLVTIKLKWTETDKYDFLSKFTRKFKAFCTSPSVKFWMEVAMYVLFITYQSYVILAKVGRQGDMCTFNTEKVIHFVWFAMLLIDEFIQSVNAGHFFGWFHVIWNKIDAMMYMVNLLGLILVNIPAKSNEDADIDSCMIDETSYDIGRVLLSVSSIMFVLRLIHMFISDKYLGPTVLMINKMMKDFRVFLTMFFMVAIAFGVGYAVVLTEPEDFTKEQTPTMIGGLFFYTFFQMYGELFVDDLGNNSEEGSTYFPIKSGSRSSLRRGVVIALVGIYMAIVVLMLVNILIAMFSDTYSKIKQRQEVIFKFQRLELLMEMENSYLPPPFSIIHIIVGHIVDKKQAKRDQSNRHAHDQDNKWFDTVIRSAIIDCLEDYLKIKRQKEGSEVQTLLQNNTRYLKERVQQLQVYMENMNFNMQSGFVELRSFIGTE